MAQGIPGVAAHVFAAGRTGAVSRIHNDIICQSHDLVAEAVVQPPGQVFFCNGAGLLSQVGSAYVADEERIAGEDGVILPIFILQ